MFAVTVVFRSVPEQAGAFLAALRENAATSLRDEPDCHRFDVCTDPGDPALFFLYELYTDPAAFETHKSAHHFRTFSELVAGWTVEKTVKTYRLDPGVLV